jgi:hypothetical protein
MTEPCSGLNEEHRLRLPQEGALFADKSEL